MTICEQITQRFPIRKTAEQKEAFRQWVMAEIEKLGYTARVEANDKGRQQNIVVGDPEQAEVTFTAHYDTPATIGLPDLQIPRNYPVYLLWQLGMVGGMLVLSLLLGFGLGMLTGSGDVMMLSFFGAFLVLMMLQLNGVANKHNVNDNTSGVAVLLETMARIPVENREKAAFIFFDNMEKGRRGSKAYAREHLEVQHTHLIVNADSVGVGDTFLVFVPQLAKQMPQYMALETLMAGDAEHQVRFCSSVTTRGNSDFRSFKCGVGIGAYRQVNGIGLYLGALHTRRDTKADQGNLTYLAEVFSGLAQRV